tara:strand:- start:2118 stop:3158 length:1041 start_codon:yes stop_codon:yes gene_type:complete
MSYVTNSQFIQPEVSPRDIVYFTPENTQLLNDENVNNHTSLQLVSLPIEYNDEESVKKLFENVLHIGTVTNVRIIERKNYNQRLRSEVVTHTAFIDFENWNNTEAVNCMLYYINNTTQNTNNARKTSITAVIKEEIHWNNGENMTHLSIREARVGSGKVESSNDTNELIELNGDDWNSLYIPILPANMSIHHPDNTTNTFQPRNLKSFIENELRLGKVLRVDFIDRELEDGQLVKSVFIHFENWNNNANANFLREKLNKEGQFKQKGYYDGYNMHKFMVRNDNADKVPGYFVFKINHKPIPDVSTTELNMSQLIAANKVLEEKMTERDELIEKLQAELAELRGNNE